LAIKLKLRNGHRRSSNWNWPWAGRNRRTGRLDKFHDFCLRRTRSLRWMILLHFHNFRLDWWTDTCGTFFFGKCTRGDSIRRCGDSKSTAPREQEHDHQHRDRHYRWPVPETSSDAKQHRSRQIEIQKYNFFFWAVFLKSPF
jgi:hypothetical protein